MYFYLFLSLREHYIVLCAQIHAPTSLPREKVSAAPSWVGLRAGIKIYRRGKSPASTGNRTQGRPAHSLITIIIIITVNPA